jgi:hypothetical protein
LAFGLANLNQNPWSIRRALVAIAHLSCSLYCKAQLGQLCDAAELPVHVLCPEPFPRTVNNNIERLKAGQLRTHAAQHGRRLHREHVTEQAESQLAQLPQPASRAAALTLIDRNKAGMVCSHSMPVCQSLHNQVVIVQSLLAHRF